MPETSPAAPAPEAHAARLFEPAPVQPATAAAVWCALDARDLLAVEGEDAVTFLQGQLTQDMARLDEDRVLYAAHCSPKGRVTALFRAWRAGQEVLLDLPPGMGSAAQRRLSMYVLRAKVRVRDARQDWERTGVLGQELQPLLETSGFAVTGTPGHLARQGPRACLCLGEGRWLAVCPPGQDGGLRDRLAQAAPAQPAGWQLASLRAGEPEVLPSTVDAFVPQMLNLDTLDGISFRKGCYTGQEIVARAHYLGRIKRRMRRFGWRGSEPPAPGAQLEVAGHSDEGAGPVHVGAVGAEADAAARTAPPDGAEGAGRAQVVWAVTTHDGGGEALAVAAAPGTA